MVNSLQCGHTQKGRQIHEAEIVLITLRLSLIEPHQKVCLKFGISPQKNLSSFCFSILDGAMIQC